MLTPRYPMPHAWKGRDGRVRSWAPGASGLALFIGFVLLSLYLLRDAVGILVLLFLLSVSVLVWLQYIAMVQAPRRSLDLASLSEIAEPRMPAIHIPTDGRALFVAFTYGVLIIPASLFGVLLGFVHPRDGFRSHIFFFVILCLSIIALVAGLGFLLKLLIPASIPRGLWLAADGVHHRVDAGHVFISWESIEGLRPGWSLHLAIKVKSGSGDTRRSRLARLLVSTRRANTIRPVFLAIHPAVVYYAMAFYHRHAELRHELSTEEGLRRLQVASYREIISEVREYGRVRGSTG